MGDYYHVLGVPRNATRDAIGRAYRKLALRCHPDKNPARDGREAGRRFRELCAARDVLSDDDRRLLYDRYGQRGPSSSSPPPDDRGGGGGGGQNLFYFCTPCDPLADVVTVLVREALLAYLCPYGYVLVRTAALLLSGPSAPAAAAGTAVLKALLLPLAFRRLCSAAAFSNVSLAARCLGWSAVCVGRAVGSACRRLCAL